MPTKLSRFCEGIMEAAWIGAVILVPAFFNIYSSRIFEPDKLTLLRSLALLVLAAWLVKLLSEGRMRWDVIDRTKEPAWKAILRIPLVWPAAALAVVYLIATFFSVTPRVSLWGSYQRLQGLYTTLSYLVIFAALAANLRRRVQVDRLVTTVVVTSLPVSLYGVLQRYQIDPVPWGGNVTTRIASNMGNSIFVAAYLIMAFPLTIGRVLDSFRSILKEDTQLPLHVARGALYVFVAALQVVALYMSGSRGPALGWLTSVYLLSLLLCLRWQKRGPAIAVLGLSLVLAAFLAVFNIPNGPLEGLRSSPAIGRFGRLLDPSSTTARVREYIWEGAVELVLPHQPLEGPDGKKDALNILRPLIGYGPESMYVAYNPFYPPKLGLVEKRNASPDRSHNETWDALVTTGVAGMAVYIAIFVSLFYYSLKWLNLIQTPGHRKLFLSLALGGGLVGAIGSTIAIGLPYIGVGIPFGILGGLWLYLAWVTLKGQTEYIPPVGAEFQRALLLSVLLAAVLGHFVEINFGIAIASTRTYFWVYSALILLVGYILPLHGEYPNVETEIASRPAEAGAPAGRTSTARRGGQAAYSRKKRIEQAGPGLLANAWLHTAIINGIILSFLLCALGYDYITNPERITSAFRIVVNAVTVLTNRDNATSYGVLALILTTWTGGAVLLSAESVRRTSLNFWKVFGGTLAIAGAVSFFFWIFQAIQLVNLGSLVVRDMEQLLKQVNMVGGLLTNYYVVIFGLVMLAAWFLAAELPARGGETSLAGPLALMAALVVVPLLVLTTNLRIIHADIAFKMAEGFNRPEQWGVATTLYQAANDRAPSEDHYYLFMGRSFLEQAKEAADAATQEQIVRDAESVLKEAQKINPLNTDHTANLARLYSWWATQSSDAESRVRRGEIASEYYARAVVLSPNHSTLWGEWAILFMEILDQQDEAFVRLEHALQLDDHYAWTQGLMADYYARQARAASDQSAQDAALEQALAHYNRAIELSPGANQTLIGYQASIASLQTQLGNLPEAIAAYEAALQLQPQTNDRWQIQEAIARLYTQLGNKAAALEYANAALAIAPAEQAERVQALISQIQTLP